jgi:hypothetical protein
MMIFKKLFLCSFIVLMGGCQGARVHLKDEVALAEETNRSIASTSSVEIPLFKVKHEVFMSGIGLPWLDRTKFTLRAFPRGEKLVLAYADDTDISDQVFALVYKNHAEAKKVAQNLNVDLDLAVLRKDRYITLNIDKNREPQITPSEKR